MGAMGVALFSYGELCRIAESTHADGHRSDVSYGGC